MPAYLLDPLSSKIVAFDQVVSESHQGENEITDHPVETGSNIVDHIRSKPTEVTLDCFVSNTPIARDDIKGRGDQVSIPINFPHNSSPFGDLLDEIFGPPPIKAISVLWFDQSFDIIRETYQDLEAFRTGGIQLTVVTSSRTYEDMVIETLGLPRDKPGGATFNVKLRKILVVQTSTTKAPKPLEKRGLPKTAKGSQATEPTDGTKAKSLALKALEALGVKQ